MNFHKFLIKLILILFIITPLLSQHQYRKGGKTMQGMIFGYVLDSLNQKPIEYASISLTSLRSGNIESGGVTDEFGKFTLSEIPPGKYELKIEFIGYKPIVIGEVKINPQTGLQRDMGKILIGKSVLQGQMVHVFEDRPIIEFETDKMVYNASDDIIAGSGTAEDVLNKVPMVTVDQDGVVSLRGNSNVKILVNGRPNRSGAGENDVDNIPASLIEKVEVITSPSAKYDPDGMAGIINIVLKKGKYEGMNGSLKINGKVNNYANIDEMNGFTAYGNYKSEKWNFYSSYSLNNRLRIVDGHRYVYTEYLPTEELPGATDLISFTFDNESERFGNSIKMGADYSINEHLILNGEIKYNVNLRTGINKQDNINPSSDQLIKENDLDDNYNVDGFFEINKTFPNPDREFNFSVSSNYKKDGAYKMLHHSIIDIIDSTLLEQDITETQLDISYKHPFSENSKLELGYNGRFTDNDEYMNFQLTENGSEFSGKNTFWYKQNIQGIFMEFDQKLNDRFSIKPSFRYEYVDKNIIFKSDINDYSGENVYAEILNSLEDSVYTDNYQTIYPDLHFTYNITEKKSIQFGLSKRVNRPGSRGHGGGSHQIRPFPRDVYSESFVFMGNPFLKPEYSTQYELSYKSPIPMGFGYVNLYYHQLENVIEWYDDDRFDNKDVLTFRNADSGENLGIEIFTMVMGQTLGGGYNLSKLEDPSGDYELNGNSQRFTLYNRINLPEKYIKYFDFEFGFFYMKLTVPGGDLFGAKGTMWANTGISKSFRDETVSISLGINNLFDTGGFQMYREKPLFGPFADEYSGYSSANEITDVATNRGGRTWTLNLKFYFGQLQEEKRKIRRGQNGGDGGMMDMGY